MAFLTPDNIRYEHGLEINEKFIPDGAVWNKTYKNHKPGDKFKAERLLSNGTGVAKKVAIHNTTDINEAKDTNDAEQYARATWPNCNMGGVIPHYYIDDIACWQLLKENEVSHHAGAKGNEEAISIEIIMSGKGDAADVVAEDRGAMLAAIVLERNGLSIDDLVTHNYYMGLPDRIVDNADKNCPYYILPHWSAFKAKVAEYLNQIRCQSSMTSVSEVRAKIAEMKILMAEIEAALDNMNNCSADKNVVDITPQETFTKGGRARLQDDAVVYGTSKRFAEFVYGVELYIRELEGDRAVVSIQPAGEITGAVNVKYLTR